MPNRITEFRLVRGMCVLSNSLSTYKRKLLFLVKWVIMALFTKKKKKTFWSVSFPFNVILLLQDQCLRQMPLILSKERGRQFVFPL